MLRVGTLRGKVYHTQKDQVQKKAKLKDIFSSDFVGTQQGNKPHVDLFLTFFLVALFTCLNVVRDRSPSFAYD